MSAIAAALLLATVPSLSAADQAALDAATHAVFAPYSGEDATVPWERDIWSREVRRLIARWQAVIPEDEPDALNDGDWLCQCQDWDTKAFRATITRRKPVAPDRAEVAVDIVLFEQVEPRDAFLAFQREEGRWMLDEMYTREYPEGIKAALVQTIAEDEALRMKQP